MSHFTTIKTKIKDPAALRKAVEEIAREHAGAGVSLVADGEARGYGGAVRSAPRVINLGRTSPYDVRVLPGKDGTFELDADLWNGHVERILGKGYGKLLQLYGVHKTLDEAARMGRMAYRRKGRNGEIKVVIQQGA